MNIFVLDTNPRLAAIHQCDKHIVKMPLETAQLLCSPFDNGTAPYRRTHYNHPSSVWARESINNYDWLITHGIHLCDEYTRRYGKTHKSLAVIYWCHDNKHLLNLPDIPLTPFKLAMPDEYKCDDAVTSYRNYYIYEKSRIATWKANQPSWW